MTPSRATPYDRAMSARGGLLDGITVLDLASWVAGPAAATMMADWGARVVKIEAPGGDPYRRFSSLPGTPQSDVNYGWVLDARNKQSVVLDLAVPASRPVLEALVRRADVLVTNFAPARLARFRLRWADLEPLNPRLVYASLTGYGDRGPEADKPAYDLNAWWARSGLMDLVRPIDGPPSPSMPGMGDHPTGAALFGAIMLGLYHRERTGRGLSVSTSLLGNGAWSNGILLQALLCGATFLERRPREQARNALANLYRCRDDRWFLLTMLNEDADWPRLLRATERADLGADPRFATTDARRAHPEALVAELDRVFATRDWPDWRARLDAHRVTASPVTRLGELLEDAQIEASGIVRPLADPAHPGLRTVASPIQVAGAEPVPAGPAPALGAHTVTVLRELGLDDAAIGRLRAAGAIPPT